MHTTARPAPAGPPATDALKDPFETLSVLKDPFRASPAALAGSR
jgi:hypothetical protein